MRQRRDEILLHFATLQETASQRRRLLEDALAFQKFLRDARDEEEWIRNKLPEACSQDLGQSLIAVHNAIAKHNALNLEIASRQKTSVDAVASQGRQLISQGNQYQEEITRAMALLGERWANLKSGAAARDTALQGALKAQQFFVDANEAESWIVEKEPQAGNPDVGHDEYTAQRLLSQHRTLVADIAAFAPVVVDLEQQAGTAVHTPKPKAVNRRKSMFLEEQTLDKMQQQASSEPMVKARYDYEARREKELTVAKGEVLRLLNEKDPNWWKVGRLSDGSSGYVPAKYVKKLAATAEVPGGEGEPAGFAEPRDELAYVFPDPTVGVPERRDELRARYGNLQAIASDRERRLEEAADLYHVAREAEEIQAWIQEKEPVFASTDAGNTVEQVEHIIGVFENFKLEKASQVPRKQAFDAEIDKLVQGRHSNASTLQQLRGDVARR
jgi:hypothetical protein